MHGYAILVDLVLGLVEFTVINRALRAYFESRSWLFLLAAAVATYIPAAGGAIALAAAILVLEWRWWLAGAIFVGGTAVLAVTGGVAALWDPGALF